MSEKDAKLEKSAEAHGKRIYEIEGSSHSEVSAHDGFIAGARWLANLARSKCGSTGEGISSDWGSVSNAYDLADWLMDVVSTQEGEK
jgi:hypothetical protein